MPQTSLPANVAVRSGKYAPLNIDSTINLAVQSGGTQSLLNITTTVVVKATPGRIRKLIITAVGGSGSWTINDCATVGAAAAANQVWTSAYNATGIVAGSIITLDWPCLVGICVTAVPGSSPIASISFD